MLARLQQITTVGLALAAILWCAYFLSTARPILAGLGALLIIGGYAAFLAFEFVVLACIDDPAGTPRATAPQLLRAWWGEVLTAPLVFCWRQPFRSNAEPDNRAVVIERMPGIVFVHGFVCNRAFWNPWMRKLRGIGAPFIAVNLEPVFGSITDYAPAIEDAVSTLEQVTATRPIIVAHSMGGLATREWLRLNGGEDRVSHVVTIGTPHRGTWLARWGRTINSLEMRLESVWLSKLVAGRADELHAKFTCFYSNCDNIVFPPSTATLPGADNRLVIGPAHVHLAFHPDVYQRVLQLLDEHRSFDRVDAGLRA